MKRLVVNTELEHLEFLQITLQSQEKTVGECT